MAIRFTVENAIATIVIDREAKLNALDLASFEAIDSAIETVNGDERIRALIIMSAGSRAFSAGADIGDLAGLDPDEASQRATYRRNVFQRLYESSIPSVAFIDGMALGGGVELALACTFRLATPRASFGMPEIKLGLLPGAGATQRLPRLVGESRALEMMLTTQRLSAEEAFRVGLIDRLVESIDDARQFAMQWCDHSREAVVAIKTAVRHAHLPLEQGLRIEGEQLALLSGTDAARTSIERFLKGRSG